MSRKTDRPLSHWTDFNEHKLQWNNVFSPKFRKLRQRSLWNEKLVTLSATFPRFQLSQFATFQIWEKGLTFHCHQLFPRSVCQNFNRKTGRPQNSENWDPTLWYEKSVSKSLWHYQQRFPAFNFHNLRLFLRLVKYGRERCSPPIVFVLKIDFGHSELVRKLDEIKRIEKQQSLRKTDSSRNFSCAHAQTRKSLSRRDLVSIRLIFHPIRSDKYQIWLRFSSFSFRSARLLASRFGLFQLETMIRELYLKNRKFEIFVWGLLDHWGAVGKLLRYLTKLRGCRETLETFDKNGNLKQFQEKSFEFVKRVRAQKKKTQPKSLKCPLLQRFQLSFSHFENFRGFFFAFWAFAKSEDFGQKTGKIETFWAVRFLRRFLRRLSLRAFLITAGLSGNFWGTWQKRYFGTISRKKLRICKARDDHYQLSFSHFENFRGFLSVCQIGKFRAKQRKIQVFQPGNYTKFERFDFWDAFSEVCQEFFFLRQINKFLMAFTLHLKNSYVNSARKA